MHNVMKIAFVLFILFLNDVNIYSQQQNGTVFTRKFAPQEGLIKSVEKPYRDEICLNGSWQF